MPRYKQLAIAPELHQEIAERARIAEQPAGAFVAQLLRQIFDATSPADASPLPPETPPLMPCADLAALLGCTTSAIRKGWRGEERWTIHVPGRVGRRPTLYPTRPLPITVEDAQDAAVRVCKALGTDPKTAAIEAPDGTQYPAQKQDEAPPLFI